MATGVFLLVAFGFACCWPWVAFFVDSFLGVFEGVALALLCGLGLLPWPLEAAGLVGALGDFSTMALISTKCP